MSDNLVQQRDRWREAIYGIIQAPTLGRKGGGVVIALVAAHEGAGTSYVAGLLHDALNEDVPASCISLVASKSDRTSGAMDDTSYPAPVRALPARDQTKRENRTEWLLAHRARYDVVLVDCSPTNRSKEVFALLSLIDGVLLITQADRTTARQIERLERSITAAGGKILGQVLNKRSYPIPEAIFKWL